MQNKTDNQFFAIDIFIVNPFVLPAESAVTSVENTQSGLHNQAAVISTNTNSIKTDKNEYATRDAVTITTAFGAGNYSLSVRKREELPTISAQSALQFSNSTESPVLTPTSKHLPELRGEL